MGGSAASFEEYHDWVDRQHGELEHGDRVVLAGKITDMMGFYRDLDILVMTSDHEGCSNVLMESMAMGKPAVVTDAGDNRDLLGDHGGVVVPTDEEEALTEGLEKLINNPELRRQMGDYNQARAKELFSVERMVSETEQTLLRLYSDKLRR